MGVYDLLRTPGGLTKDSLRAFTIRHMMAGTISDEDGDTTFVLDETVAEAVAAEQKEKGDKANAKAKGKGRGGKGRGKVPPPPPLPGKGDSDADADDVSGVDGKIKKRCKGLCKKAKLVEHFQQKQTTCR